uniref:Uncharacterized protein n=1 Tax=Glossina brevipalpis TaxID=37001 RepID=A0A1A9X133_9MUSC
MTETQILRWTFSIQMIDDFEHVQLYSVSVQLIAEVAIRRTTVNQLQNSIVKANIESIKKRKYSINAILRPPHERVGFAVGLVILTKYTTDELSSSGCLNCTFSLIKGLVSSVEYVYEMPNAIFIAIRMFTYKHSTSEAGEIVVYCIVYGLHLWYYGTRHIYSPCEVIISCNLKQDEPELMAVKFEASDLLIKTQQFLETLRSNQTTTVITTIKYSTNVMIMMNKNDFAGAMILKKGGNNLTRSTQLMMGPLLIIIYTFIISAFTKTTTNVVVSQMLKRISSACISFASVGGLRCYHNPTSAHLSLLLQF